MLDQSSFLEKLLLHEKPHNSCQKISNLFQIEFKKKVQEEITKKRIKLITKNIQLNEKSIAMSSLNNDETKSQGSKKSGKIHSAIEKAQAIQQREQLRQMITDKFNKDFSKGNKNITRVIEDIVADYFGREKITEDTLRALKQDVAKAVENYRKTSQSQKAPSERGKSQTSKQDLADRKNEADKRSQAPSQRNQQQDAKSQSSKSSLSSKSSQTSSMISKSVYQVEGDDDDEWATLVKFDTELFKKQKQLEKMREEQFKKKIKKELDKQMQQKRRKKDREQKQSDEYFRLQQEQAKLYDERQKEKKEDYQKKIELEKKMRDRQIKDENKRKKVQKKKEDELDHLLVTKIKEEISVEEQETRDRKQKELQRFQQVMIENDENQRRLREEAQRQRLEDIKSQEQYARIQDELERKRDLQKKQRQEKIKAVMASFADSVIKDQKQQIRVEDEKMLRHIENQLKKEKQQEERKKQKQEEQKKQMRDYLARQVEDKKVKQAEEKKIDDKQAEVWKEDTTNFFENQKSKNEYLKNVHKQHEDILKEQMKDKEDGKNRKKMNTLQLLYNKALMKAAADQTENVRKTKI